MSFPNGLTKTDEINTRRSLTSKTYKKNATELVHQCHVGHQHYFNKLGSGDGEVRWRELDWTLQWDDVKRGWFFNFHSFNPFLPEYADQWVEFRDLFDGKDQTTRYKAQCSHVLGRLLPSLTGVTETNCVIYDDAFGTGIDYILYFTRTSLKKVVRIRDGFYANAEQRFKFEVDFPDAKIVRAVDKDAIAYELDTTLAKTFDTPKQTLLGNDLADGKEWYTYMRDFQAWDSSSQINISVDYSVVGTQKFIEKIVPASFLNTATGDVYTDTTTSYFAAAGDGRTSRSGVDETLATIRAGVGTSSTTTGGSNWLVFFQATTTTNQWGTLDHCPFPIDTSGIDDAETVTAATFKMYHNGASGNSLGINNSDLSKFVLVEGDQVSTSAPTNSDYQRFKNVDFGRSAQQKTITDAGAGYFNIALLSAGLTFINKTGFSKFGIKLAADFDNTAPTWISNAWTALQIYYSEDTGTTRDPFIEVVSSIVTSSFTPRMTIY